MARWDKNHAFFPPMEKNWVFEQLQKFPKKYQELREFFMQQNKIQRRFGVGGILMDLHHAFKRYVYYYHCYLWMKKIFSCLSKRYFLNLTLLWYLGVSGCCHWWYCRLSTLPPVLLQLSIANHITISMEFMQPCEVTMYLDKSYSFLCSP